MKTTSWHHNGMLDGIKVLDLSRVLAGPCASMMLGDLGANVIKVEHPQQGDETRGWGPPFDQRGESAYFLSVNRNKLGITADLDDPEGISLVRSLAGQADVLLENFRPGALARRGLTPSSLREENPGLVWCTITGFGDASDRPGYDFVVQAECGWMAVTGEPGGAPMKSGVAFADVMAGKDAVAAILAALVSRARSGMGRVVSVSLQASATAALVNVAQNVLVSGHDANRWGNSHPNLVPYQLFEAADRGVIIAVGSDAQWRACAGALGLDELGADAALATNAGRLAHRALVARAIAERVRSDISSSWIARLTEAGVPCGIVRTVTEALGAVEASPLTGVAPSLPGSVRLPPPLLGEHTAIVRDKGWHAFD